MGEGRRGFIMKTLTDQTHTLATALLKDVHDAYATGEAPFFHSLERFYKGAKGLESMATYIEIMSHMEGGSK